MKKRRTLIVALTLVAALCLGIGYATVTTFLNITGTATVTNAGSTEAFSKDVVFTDVIDADTGAAIVATKGSASVGDGKEADFNLVGLKGAGDSISLIYTITNTGDVDANISIDTVNCSNTDTTNFDLSYTWMNGDAPDAVNPHGEKELDAGASVKVKVTVTLKNTLTSDTPTLATFFVRLKAVSVS